MTVLAEYQRLEAEGVWRASSHAQRRDVIVSIGKATLTITAPNGTALTHWSLPAVVRANPGEFPAIYGLGQETAETLEISETEMVEAIDKVLNAIRRPRGSSGWMGRTLRLGILAAAVAGLALWLPSAITAYTASLVPDVAQAQIGEKILTETERVTGSPCSSPAGDRALVTLSERLFGASGVRLVVVPSTLKTSAHVPGGTILLSHTLVEDFETPDVVAGFAVAEHLRSETGNSLGVLLEASPFRASLALLSTGRLREIDLQRMAEWLVVKPAPSIPEAELLKAMNAREISTAPYGYAIDISGEKTANLITSSGTYDPALDDNDWIALQLICSE